MFSALPLRTDIERPLRHVRFVPGADISSLFKRAAAGERAGLGAHAYAIFFSTALKRTLRLPTSAVASAIAPSSV
jgi:hypothetical protein